MCSPSNSKRLALAALVVLLVGRRASAQQAGDLQQQLQQLKQQYEQTTKDLQQRIAVLEQQIEKQNEAVAQEKETAKKTDEATVSAADLAAQQAAKKVILGQSNQVGAKYQGTLPSEPSYDLLQEAQTEIPTLK